MVLEIYLIIFGIETADFKFVRIDGIVKIKLKICFKSLVTFLKKILYRIILR
jgi:hypothetical protein